MAVGSTLVDAAASLGSEGPGRAVPGWRSIQDRWDALSVRPPAAALGQHRQHTQAPLPAPVIQSRCQSCSAV